MCNIHLFNTEVPESNWIQEIPEYCFKHRSTEVYKSSRYNKPVYIVENHAGAIKAWYEQREGKPALITFDEHTDTMLPFLRYMCNHLEHSEEKLICLLDNIRKNIAALDPNDFFRKGNILTCEKDSVACKLWYDEQITLALYLGIINKAYICSPGKYRPEGQTENPIFLNIYSKIQYCSDLVHKNAFFRRVPGADGITNAIFNLTECLNQDLNNNMLDLLKRYAFPDEKEFILDLDLDFFKNPFFLKLNWENYSTFFELVRNAKAITIATETEWVQNNCENFNDTVDTYNEEAETFNLSPMPNKRWGSIDVLQGVLNLIDFELSGKREIFEEMHEQLFSKMQGLPLIREDV